MTVYGTVIINGISCPVTNLIDIDGDDTDDIDKACMAVAKYTDNEWVVFNIENTGIYPTQ